jgi:RNA polymerase sigma factor (sigma-70 family)
VIVSRHIAAVGKQLEVVFNRGTVTGLSAGKLLERFVQGRDEAAFAALVSLHGPMVLGVCRRILRDEHDVEDAFQATFLVLVRRAGAIRRGDLVGHWLYGVAHRVAVRARAQAARRRVHEPAGLDIDGMRASQSLGEESRHDLRMVLDEELARLPTSLRAPVVLCYLEGLTHEQAAQRLRWPVGTIRSRLARARDRLRRRLTRRGLATDGAALSGLMIGDPVSLRLIESTIEASLGFGTRHVSAAGTASSAAAALARGVLHAMMISKIKILGAATVAGILVLGGAQSLARQFGTSGRAKPTQAAEQGETTREDAMLRSITEVERTLVDIGRQQESLQKELQSLADQILALKAARTSSRVQGAAPVPSQSQTETARMPGKPESESEKLNGLLGGAAAKEENIASGVNEPRGPTGPGRGRRSENSSVGAPSSGPTHVDLGACIFVSSPSTDRIAVFDKRTGESKLLELPLPEGSSRTITPISGPEALALHMLDQGGAKMVSRIAVYTLWGAGNSRRGRWYPQELREPVDQATPVIGQLSVAYVLDRYIYAFSTRANRWDVLELPVGSRPQLTESENQFKVELGSHIYSFNVLTGQWDDLDLNTILDPQRNQERKDDARKPDGTQ